jgi:hypothetical protein
MKLPRQVLVLPLAYGAAVPVATMVTIAMAVLMIGIRTPGSFGEAMQQVPRLFLAGMVITSITALPGWGLTVMVAELFAERRRRFFLPAGALTALFAHALLAYGSGGRDLSLMTTMVDIVAASVPGGIAGGWVHWHVAGRTSGAWRA